MYLDKDHIFSDAQALTATAASTNLIDLGPGASRADVGDGETLSVHLSLDVAASDSNGNETYSCALQTDDNSAFASATELGTATITRGDAAGSTYGISVPSGCERFLRLYFTLGGTDPTVTLTAHLTSHKAIQNWNPYANAITISQ